MAKRNLWLDILVLFFLCFLTIDAEAASPGSLLACNCSVRCGNVNISFPFGMGRPECFWNEWYEIDCRYGTTPFLKMLNLQVINISLPIYYYNWTIGYYDYNNYQYLTAKFPVKYSKSNCNPKPKAVSQPPSLQGSPFFFSPSWNIFAAVGCNVSAQLTSNTTFVGCKIERSGGNFSRNSTCSGFDGCCKTRLPSGLQALTDLEFINIDQNSTATNGQQQCNYAFVASQWWLQNEFTDLHSLKVEGHAPVFLTWGVSSDSHHANELSLDDRARYDSNAGKHYCSRSTSTSDIIGTWWWTCYCRDGYDGNPYLKDGCHDINECEEPSNQCSRRCVNTQGSFHCVDPRKTLKLVLIGISSSLGALLLALLGWWLYRIIKKRKEKKLREKYFKRNGGLKLQEQLLSSEGNGRLFNKREIEIATENFSESRILGKGGQGTVYKGMLTDGKIVAIKKALVIDEEKVEQFINEVLILTQISHRNIVQLLGCCLEIEIPLLVYEFIPNGNLYEYLHGSNKDDPVSWEVRLQLAIEIAGALFYLHSAASIPVYHRDIKSTNILLDEKYQAKIADFGTSRLASLDETHVTTLVQGTIGYLDPEYFQTNQFTDKSDVYSFGVVLVELLTRQKPISTMRTEEAINLATYFTLSIEDGHLFDILDAKVLDQATKEEVFNIANLAQRCLLFYGRNRPAMREVVIELERIKKLRHVPNVEESGKHHDQVQCPNISKSTTGSIELNTNVAASFAASLDVQPLLLGRTWQEDLPC